eukprot:jgi/Mesen1/10498/ME000083S10009
MEECCAVCAEPLEWVAYGVCNHKEVCSTCITRLRMVMDDKRCCICKQECPAVFVTKALGDYTRTETDFASLPSRVIRPGISNGDLWYDSTIVAYFDDEDHYKTTRAMCRLACSICDMGTGEVSANGTKGGPVRPGFTFRAVDALKHHLRGVHKLSMCDLCLEGRKVFVSEQKLYDKEQLKQHCAEGNSEADGTDEERGGFKGHPSCHFCKRRFYGDNELYQHMSRDHFTCFICQRARPGSYEYFKNYDDLENHFRRDHYLCEDQQCLEKKFTVFPTEIELKRHSAQVHAGNMSRAERNRALQIPATQLFSFRRAGHESEDGGSFGHGSSGRGGGGGGRRGRQAHGPSVRVVPHPDTVEASIRARVESADMEFAIRESAALAATRDEYRPPSSRPSSDGPSGAGPSGIGSSGGAAGASGGVGSEAAFPPLGGGDESVAGGPGGGYREASGGGGNWRSPVLAEGAFPPLPGATKSAKKRAKAKAHVPGSSMASLLGGGGGATGGGLRVLHASGLESPGGTSAAQRARPTHGGSRPSVSSVSGPGPPPPEAVQRPSCGAASGYPASGSSLDSSAASGSDRATGGGGVSGILPNTSIGTLEELRAANKVLIERIRQGLKGNEQQYAEFKDVSGRFRRGEMSSQAYHGHVVRLGLSYVVPELARLCPDPDKQRELLEAHAAGIRAGAGALSGQGPGAPSSVSLPHRAAAGLGPSVNPPPVASSATSGPAMRPLGVGSWRAPPAPSPGDRALAPSGSRASVGGDKNKGKAKLQADGTGDGVHAGEPQVLLDGGYRRDKNKGKAMQDYGAEGPSRRSPEGELFGMISNVHLRESASAPNLHTYSVAAPRAADNSSGIARSYAADEGWPCCICTLLNEPDCVRCSACGSARPGAGVDLSDEGADGTADSMDAKGKKKKAAKFQRMRLGDAYAAGLFGPAVTLEAPPVNPWGTSGPSPVAGSGRGRGAWSNGGGQRLAAHTSALNSSWAKAK